MNDAQRKFLISHVQSTANKEISALNDSQPEKPSLNNYLINAVMNGTAKFRDQSVILDWVHQKILTHKDGDSDNILVCHGQHRNLRAPDGAPGHISIPADVLFELPSEYLAALEQYKERYREWREEKDAIIKRAETLVMKIQLGSNATLDKLIQQADDLADINIIDTNLKLISNG